MQRRTYTDQQKAQAIAALLTGDTTTAVAERFGIAESTVRVWKVREARALLTMEDTAEAATTVVAPVAEKKEELGELVTEYVRESLRTLRLQAGEFADRQWLQKQNAADAAVLHGVLADKTIRIIQAIHADD